MTLAFTVAVIVIAYLIHHITKIEDQLKDEKESVKFLKQEIVTNVALTDKIQEKSDNIEMGLMTLVKENNQLLKYVNEFRTLDLDSYRQHELKRLKADIKSLQDKQIFLEEVTEDQTELSLS